MTLAISGLAIVLLSIVSSAGFFGYLGVSCAMIIFQILPFLVLAVGVDNIFIFVQTLQSVSAEHPDLVGVGTLARENLATSCISDMQHVVNLLFQGTVEALSRVVGEVGPSMFQSSVAQAITFSLGSLSSMPAIRVRASIN